VVGDGRGERGRNWRPRGFFLEQHPPLPFNPYFFTGYGFDPYMHQVQFRPQRVPHPRNQEAHARGVNQNQNQQHKKEEQQQPKPQGELVPLKPNLNQVVEGQGAGRMDKDNRVVKSKSGKGADASK
jgi:hypothetical protein